MASLQPHHTLSTTQPSLWGYCHHHHRRIVLLRRSWTPRRRSFSVRAVDGVGDQPRTDSAVVVHTSINSPPTPTSIFPHLTRPQLGLSVGILGFVATLLGLTVRAIVVNYQSRHTNRSGSVADLVRRGQLKSDRRGISKPLKYDDPFNNPMVKVGKANSTVEMCGKVYRLAPVTLTQEQQTVHQRRRSRAYQWKRPTVFLKEGDSVPPDVDPDTVRWIPANHPFATTSSDIDEDLAQNNVRQKHGVPFRIKAEHEALQAKLEALQDGQKLSKLTIDSSNAKDYERAFKLNPKPPECAEESDLNENMGGNSKAPLPERLPNSSSEEMQKP